ncbi:MAG: hypothetical protein IPH57_16370 [Saprospiraceae bacterium]|nr:hypothetical protein [Saprospiraceae bacterium]
MELVDKQLRLEPKLNIGNGINLNKIIHNGWDAAHKVYNENLTKCLDKYKDTFSEADDAKLFLENLQEVIRTQLLNGKKLNEIIFP